MYPERYPWDDILDEPCKEDEDTMPVQKSLVTERQEAPIFPEGIENGC